LSRQIKALEDEIGQCLLERQAHSIRLTPAGEALLREAGELLQRADAMLERVRAAGQSVRLRVGYAPSLASGLLSGAVGELFPKASECARGVVRPFHQGNARRTGERHAGCRPHGRAGARQPRIEMDAARARPWQLAVNRQHRLARSARVSPEEVAREPLLVFLPARLSRVLDHRHRWLREQRQRPAIAGEYDGVNSLLAAVESGLGVAIRHYQHGPTLPERVRLKALPPRRSRCALPPAIARAALPRSRSPSSSKNCATPLKLSLKLAALLGEFAGFFFRSFFQRFFLGDALLRRIFPHGLGSDAVPFALEENHGADHADHQRYGNEMRPREGLNTGGKLRRIRGR
jgi:DNA-binding transcriptional LysR family regulator